MKRILTILAFIIIALTSKAQQHYKPSLHAGPQNKPSGISSATPLDSRSYFYDTLSFSYRPYANRAEVLSYLYLATYRRGQFSIIIDSISHKWAYWFRDSTRDQDLVLQYNFAASSTDSSVFATLYRVDSAKLNLRTEIAGKISTTLPSGQILVGNISNVATAVTPGNDVSVTSGGSFTVLNQLKTASNGLTASTGNVKIGGTLTDANTTLLGNTGTENLLFTNVHNFDTRYVLRTKIFSDAGQATATFAPTFINLTGGDSVGVESPTALFSVKALASKFYKPVSILDTFKLPNAILKTLDTANYKLGVYDASGNGFKMNWPVSGGGNGSADSLKHLFVDTSTNRNNYVLAFDSANHKWILTAPGSGGVGSGTVTQVNTGYGLSGGPLTTTGTLLLDSTTLYLTALRRKDSTLYFPKYRGDTLATNIYNALNGKQPQLNGTGFVKATGTTISYDNSTYITGNQTITFTPTGDVQGSASGTTSITPALTIQANAVTTTKINNNAVTYAKMQPMTANKLLGSGASGTAVAEITLGTGLSFTGTTLNASGGGGGTLAKTQYNDSVTNGTDTVSDVNNPGNDGYQNRNNAFNFDHKVQDALRQDSVFNIMAIGHSFVDGLHLETNWKQILGNKIPFSGPGFLTSDASNYNFGGSVPLATAHWTKDLGEGLDLWSVNSTNISTDIDFANSGTDIGYNQFDSLRIYYLIKTGGGTFQIKLLTSVLITINTSTGTPGTLGVAAIGGFDKNTANDFIIHQTAYNTTGVSILGYNAILKNTNGIRVDRVGHSGAVTQDYLNADSTMQAQQLQEINPKVVYIILSINDRRFSVTLPQYHSNMHRIINRIKLAVPGVNIVLVAEEDYDQVIWGSSLLSAATWANETRKISIEDTCGYLDLNKVFGTFAQFQRNGILEDGLHPSYSSHGVIANNAFDMIPTISNTPLYSPHEVYAFKQWTWDADFFNFKDHNGSLLAAIYSGSAPSYRLYSGGLDTYKAGTILGPGYMVTGMNDNNLLGVNPSFYGGAIMFDGRFITAPIRFDIQSATPGTAGGVGDNLKWQFGSATEFPLVGAVFDYTDAIKEPVGTTAQRPTGAAGYMRDNSDSANYAAGFEGWNEGRARYERFAMKPYVDSIVAANSAVIPPNLGSAYRVYAPQTPGFKSLAAGYGVLIDSVTTGQLGFKLDSATVYTYVRSIAGGSDTLKLAFAGTGERPFWGSNDTLHGKTIKGLGNVSLTSGTDSTINIQLTGFTAGRIPFSSSSSVITDDSNMNWDNTSKTLVLGPVSGSFTQNLMIRGLTFTGDIPSAPGGRRITTNLGTYTDNVTSASGTVSGQFSTESFAGATLAASNSNVTYTNGTTLYVTAPTAGTNVTFTNKYAIKTLGNLSVFGGFTETNSIRSNGSTPGIAAGTGAGTSPTISITGSDMAGIVSITTGTLPTLSATVATITYSVDYGTKPAVILTPANSSASLLSGVTSVFVNDGSSSSSAFLITAGTTALTAATTYLFYYHVIR